MTRSVEVNLTFEQMPAFLEILEVVESRGIETQLGGELWVTSDGDYDWDRRPLSDWSSVVSEMTTTFDSKASVGFGVTWPRDMRRGSLLVMPQLRMVSFDPDVETMTRGSAASSVGLGWYLDEMVAIFAPLNPISVLARNEP